MKGTSFGVFMGQINIYLVIVWRNDGYPLHWCDKIPDLLYMLWFNFSLGANFLKLVQFLFSSVVYSFP